MSDSERRIDSNTPVERGFSSRVKRKHKKAIQKHFSSMLSSSPSSSNNMNNLNGYESSTASDVNSQSDFKYSPRYVSSSPHLASSPAGSKDSRRSSNITDTTINNSSAFQSSPGGIRTVTSHTNLNHDNTTMTSSRSLINNSNHDGRPPKIPFASRQPGNVSNHVPTSNNARICSSSNSTSTNRQKLNNINSNNASMNRQNVHDRGTNKTNRASSAPPPPTPYRNTSNSITRTAVNSDNRYHSKIVKQHKGQKQNKS